MDTNGNNYFLFFSVISVNLLSFSANAGFSWTSPFLPKLNGHVDPEKNPIPYEISVLEESWITTMMNIGALCGPLCTGQISRKIGKKMTLVLFSIPVLFSNIILIFANTVWHFYTSRFLLGLGVGCVYCIIPAYVAEISDVPNRGKMGLSTSLINLISHISVVFIGPYVTIKTFAYLSLIPTILFMVILIPFIPESPYYFVSRNRMSEAENALKKFRQTSNVKFELIEISNSVNETKIEGSFYDIFRTRVVLKGLVVTVGLIAAQQVCGAQPLNAYQQEIFRSTSSNIPSEISVMIVGIFQFIPSVLIVFIVDKVGRKILLLLSYFGLLLSLITIGSYFYFKEQNFNVDSIFWVPIASSCLFMASFKLGAGPVAWSYVGEVFPSNLQIYMSSIVTFAMFLFGIIVTFIFPIMFTYIGTAWTFWIFGVCTATSIIFITIKVPEIRGKSFVDIQMILKK
ncbi:facilitated trehalose transporter Tret1-like isoform X1 [Diorhabda sublineata]|uniref:facilitated trehalose transporter Tret1-like isoform X1 n=2 Tax=Diorhabda sublineata TaxID=1163346 RepID=UPI0024E186E7|nr:facilitated trehalose transporter Tret1-like isoform X1 [Diorhabda sublineata]